MWAYKRAPELVMQREKAVHVTTGGIPFLDPAVVLLFKAKHLRPKDSQDFDRLLPDLSAGQVDWLRAALLRFHPKHEWLNAF